MSERRRSPGNGEGLKGLAELAARGANAQVAVIGCTDGRVLENLSGFGTNPAELTIPTEVLTLLSTEPELYVPDISSDSRFNDLMKSLEPSGKISQPVSMASVSSTVDDRSLFVFVLFEGSREDITSEVRSLKRVVEQLEQKFTPAGKTSKTRCEEEQPKRCCRLMDSLENQIALLNSEGEIVMVNRAWEEFGLNNGLVPSYECKGRNYFEVCRQSDSSDEKVEEIVAGMKAVASGKQDVFQAEYPCHSPDEKRWFQMNVTPLQNNTDYLVVSHENITNRKGREMELQSLKEEYETVVENVQDALFYLNVRWEGDEPVFYYAHLNSTLQEKTGLKLSEMKGKTPAEVFEPELAAHFHNKYRACAVKEEVVSYEEELSLPSGKSVWHTKLAPVKKDDRVTQIVGAARNITHLKEVENSLREREDLLRTLTENLDEVVWLFNADFSQVLYVNQNRYEQVYGGDADELKEDASAYLDCIHPEDRERVSDAVEALLQGEEVSLEYRVNPDQNYSRWVWAQGVPVRDEEGKIDRIAGYSKDVTERKRAENQLRDSEERFRQMAENIQDVFYLYAPDYSEVHYVSPAYEEIWQRDLESLYDNPWEFADAIHVDDREGVLEQKQIYLENGLEGDTEMEYRIVQPGGAVRWIRDEMYPVLDENGNLDKVAGTARDVTHVVEQRERVRESQKQEERFRQLAETLGVIFWLYDPEEEKYLYLSSDCNQLWGFSREELYKHPDLRLENIHSEDRNHVEKLYQNQLKKGFSETYRVNLTDTTLWVHDRVHPVRQNGEITLVAGLAEDVTEQIERERRLQEEIERAERASKLKSDFVARVTHDIRTPLNSILGLTEILSNSDLSSMQQDHLRSIHIAGESMLHLTNDILDLDRIENGQIQLVEKPFSLQRLLDDVCSLFLPKINEMDVSLESNVDPGVPDRLIGDPNRLTQILNNLVGNAVKFTTSGRIGIDVEALSRDDSEITLEFRVDDTGPGIPPDKQEKIFESHTGDFPTASPSEKGVGLGLSICKELVNLMEGDIFVESEPGKGSTFKFNVLLKEEKVKQGGDGAAQNVEEIQVLVVDDSPADRTIIRRYLSDHGMEVDELQDPGKAKEVLGNPERGNEYDVVFLDKRLGRISGLDVLKNIHEHPGTLSTERIYIVSGEARDEVRNRLGDIPIAGILEKPVSKSQLAQSVYAVLEQFGGGTDPDTDTWSESLRFLQELSLRILVAEDDPGARTLLKEYLRGVTEDLSFVKDGQSVVKERFERSPDIVLMDLEMPKMNGLEATRAIRKREEEEHFENVPIVFETAQAMKQVQEECLKAGANGFIRKPLDRFDLYRAMKESLEASGNGDV